MSDIPEVLDAEVVNERSMALAAPARPSTLAVTPNVGASELVARLDVIREAMQTAMVKDIDYGVIPGTGSKPTLLKPGAEKLGVLFQLDVQLSNNKTFDGEHLTVESCATVYHAPTGTRLGYGEGMCTTRERKYGKRKQDRACPACGEETIKRSKFPPRENPSAEPGWYCYAKIGGCGQNYPANDPRITDQVTGDVVNPDIPDAWNTVLKMAEKRARIDAVLAVTGASALFTQDVEDFVPNEPAAPSVPAWVTDVKRRLREQRVTTEGVRNHLRAVGVSVGAKENPVPLVEALTEVQAGAMLERMHVSDVPGPAEGEFVHQPVEGGIE